MQKQIIQSKWRLVRKNISRQSEKMAVLFTFFCTSCGNPLTIPTVTDIQAAYDRESTQSNTKHDKNLQVLSIVRCEKPNREKYTCLIEFMSKADPKEHIYYDVVSVANKSGKLVLKSGLCRK